MAYNGRRGPNVSAYIANLNAIPTAEDLQSSNRDNFIDDDLAMFTNTQFFDFDLGQEGDLQAGSFAADGQPAADNFDAKGLEFTAGQSGFDTCFALRCAALRHAASLCFALLYFAMLCYATYYCFQSSIPLSHLHLYLSRSLPSSRSRYRSLAQLPFPFPSRTTPLQLFDSGWATNPSHSALRLAPSPSPRVLRSQLLRCSV